MIKVIYPSNQGELGYIVRVEDIVEAVIADDELVDDLVDAIIEIPATLAKLKAAVEATP